MYKVIFAAVIILALLFLVINCNIEPMNNYDSKCVKKSKNIKYPVIEPEYFGFQRRMFDSLTYDYIDDKSKAVNLNLVCF
jgi:hypothetical protein